MRLTRFARDNGLSLFFAERSCWHLSSGNRPPGFTSSTRRRLSISQNVQLDQVCEFI